MVLDIVYSMASKSQLAWSFWYVLLSSPKIVFDSKEQ